MRWLIACILGLTTTFAVADGPVYAEVQFAGAMTSNENLDFYPTFGSVNAGIYLLPGIGMEVFGDLGLEASSDEGLEMELEGAYGVAARFQSPGTPGGLQGYIALGYVNYTLDQRPTGNSGSSNAINEDFGGFRASVGLMQRLRSNPNLQLTAEYRHYNADEPLRIDALLIGLRVNTL
ncbi:MAG: hypothetical protein AB8B63_02710 [Granulosicoccus sp.]